MFYIDSKHVKKMFSNFPVEIMKGESQLVFFFLNFECDSTLKMHNSMNFDPNSKPQKVEVNLVTNSITHSIVKFCKVVTIQGWNWIEFGKDATIWTKLAI